MPRFAAHAPRSETIARELKCLELRRDGLTFLEIALHDDVGYANAKGAQRAYLRALGRTLQPAADAARAEWRDRLLAQYRVAWSIAVDTKRDPEVRLSAIRTCVRVTDRAAHLDGLDAPVRHSLVVTDAITQEIAALADELEAQARGEVTVP